MNSMARTQSYRRQLLDPAHRARFAAVNAEPFGFRHELASVISLNVSDVMALSDRLPDGEAFKAWQNGITAIDGGWETKPSERLTLAETLAGIETNHSLVVLKHIEQDPVVGPHLRDLLQEVFDCSSSQFRDDVMLGECLLFINSPHRKTAYHFDLEASFLLQLSGTKTVYAWPTGNRDVVPESEIEAYCGQGHLDAGRYKSELDHLAKVYHLEAGDGVHFPSLGPHWVQNGDTVSISINVNYDVRSLHGSAGKVMALNHRLQKLGLRPRKYGISPQVDRVKIHTWSALNNGRRLVRRLSGHPDAADGYPVWRPERSNG